ncbi:related to 3`,5`-cyclic-nucleotide phosphodiesterase [Cephalotrichum gorgonifer]|uniref:Related to 3`,5`-cyclic-nucleotide phosphodiesterase n=1 Tax=Cephalotrichum gorgonifer TaxID=2041049 RepID=A0AAE8MUV6_9PEZI|nr:related to 3`,5`-cyclic-nucleotide phosphodiesterase [Cephalotrichum gorgonifer]
MAETRISDVPEADKKSAGLQVIVLGSGGGPVEHNTTAFLVRSIARDWKRGSVIAVDAGVHLGAMVRILESSQPQNLGTQVPLPHILQDGPFSGLELRSPSPTTNAAFITQSIIDTYLITHPHLDHISAFVVNTAGLPSSRPKRLAGLPSTIAAFKTHIFNNVIWPNLSDENNGAGLVTYMRLVEGGSPAMGEGDDKGYMEVSDGLAVKTWGVSHGHCIENHSHRGSQSSQGGRVGSTDASSGASPIPRSQSHPYSLAAGSSSSLTPSRLAPLWNQPTQNLLMEESKEKICVYDSSAYFIRDIESGKEVLIFGDVEPDSISLSPRNLLIWQEAAPKVASGALQGIFIECSYDNSQPIDRLFGHLKPCFVIEELKVLAREVESERKSALGETKKRKRGESQSVGTVGVESPLTVRRRVREEPLSPKSLNPDLSPSRGPAGKRVEISAKSTVVAVSSARASPDDDEGSGSSSPAAAAPKKLALEGLKVVLIHVKDRLADGYDVGEKILQELRDEEEVAQLGCEFIVSTQGQSILF